MDRQLVLYNPNVSEKLNSSQIWTTSSSNPGWAKDAWSQSVARTVSEGMIDHQTPDKANFQVTKFQVLQGKGNDGKPAYLAY